MYTKTRKYSLLFLLMGLFFAWSTLGYTAEVYNYEYYFEKYDIQVVHNPAVDLAFPAWAKPNPEQNITDLSYRVYDVLPFDDKDADMYIVYSEHGIVVPVLTPNREDQELIASGKMFDHYEYLERGALYYYGERPDYGASNMVIAAHSSFQKDQSGDYKTTFQALPISRKGDKIFIYIKNKAGTYDFYEYIITESAETDMYNTSILREQPGKYLLTTYGCYEIGKNDRRRYNTAELSEKKLAHSDLRAHAAAPAQEQESESVIIKSTPKVKITKRVIDIPITTIPAHDVAPKQPITKTTSLNTTIKSTITAKAKALYDALRARNQYVIADTQPASTIQKRLAARLNKAPTNKVTTYTQSSHTLTIYKVIIAKASKDISLANKIASKLKILIKKLEGVKGKEPQLKFMKTLYTALQPYISSTTKTTNSPTNTTTTDEKVIILENGKRFMSK